MLIICGNNRYVSPINDHQDQRNWGTALQFPTQYGVQLMKYKGKYVNY